MVQFIDGIKLATNVIRIGDYNVVISWGNVTRLYIVELCRSETHTQPRGKCYNSDNMTSVTRTKKMYFYMLSLLTALDAFEYLRLGTVSEERHDELWEIMPISEEGRTRVWSIEMAHFISWAIQQPEHPCIASSLVRTWLRQELCGPKQCAWQ